MRGLELLIALLVFAAWVIPVEAAGESSPLTHQVTSAVRAESSRTTLYLLATEPTGDFNLSFPTVLYRLTEEGIEEILEVVEDPGSKAGKHFDSPHEPSGSGTLFVHPHPEERIVLVGGYSGPRYTFHVVPMDSPWKPRAASIEFKGTLLTQHLMIIDGKSYLGLRIAERITQETLKFSLIGVDLTSLEEEELEWDSYCAVRVQGVFCTAISGGDYLDLYAQENGVFEVRVKGPPWLECGWKQPPNVNWTPATRVALYTDNSWMLVMAAIDDRVKQTKDLGYSPFYFYDKVSGEWRREIFEGGSTGGRGFGPWFAAYVADASRHEPSPGREKRNQEITRTGRPPDMRFESWEVYYPGIHILYNVENQKKYELKTGQGDSEILLIEGDWVYYRVNEGLYRARIGTETLGNHRLLAEDLRIRDVHWAFSGPPPPAESEEAEPNQ